jgi:predicted O-linked N-acetylglucosamine transferase (SPINDLY family)
MLDARLARAVPTEGDFDRADMTLDLPEALTRAVAAYQAGKIPETVRICKKIMDAAPDCFDALHLLGVVEAERGHLERGHRLISRALKLNPRSAPAYLDLGNALLALQRPQEALAGYDKALAIKPDFAEALNNRGNALFALNRPEEALASYDKALAIKPAYAKALNNRGNALFALKRYDEALASYDKASAIEPNHPDTLSNRGNVLLELNRPQEALASYDRALAIKPDFAGAMNSRGNALVTLGYHDRAIADFERVLRINPDYPYTRGKLLRLRMQSCDWASYEREVSLVTAGVRAGKRSDQPFSFLALSESAGDQLLCSQIFAKDKCPPSPVPVWQGERYRHDRIRVAYLSADFHDHPMALLMAGLFELHDRSRFETIAVSFGPESQSEIRKRLEGAFERFIDVRQRSDRDAAGLLRELEVDIAVDLMGFTTGCRPQILALRPSPIQVNYLGFPGTTGADYMDYIIADRLVIPEEHHRHYSEKVVYLPDTFQANDSKRRISERTPTRAEARLPAAGFVFCSFNNNYKINPRIFDIWMRLLKEVEDSALWLLEGNPAVVPNLRREAAERGVAPERLVFAPRAELEDYLARFRLADLFLDTLPFNAGATASDALWAGLPVVTCLGSTFAGRMAGSLLTAIGLPELVTRSLDAYEALALKLAKDRNMLEALKAKLVHNRAAFPLFDTNRFRRHIEAAYEMMWERYQRREPPQNFAVQPTAS